MITIKTTTIFGMELLILNEIMQKSGVVYMSVKS